MKDRAHAMRGIGWFLLANAAVFKLITLYFWSGILEPADGVAAQAYRTLSGLAHWPLLAALFIGAPAGLVALVWPRRALLAAVAVLAATLGCAVMLVDGAVFAQYRMHLGVYVWGLIWGGAGEETFFFSPPLVAVLVGLGAAALAAQAALLHACRRWAQDARSRGPARAIFSGWLAVLVGVNVWYAWADAHYDSRVARESANLPFHYPLTAKRTLARWGLVDPAKAPVAVALPGSGAGLHYPQVAMDCEVQPQRPNILLVIVDAWRADQLDAQVTPRISALAAQSMRFRNHVSGGNVTRFGIFSIFYGLPGSYWWTMLRTQTPPVLIRELQRQEYDLGIFGSAPLVHPEFDRTVFSGVPGLRTRTPGNRPVERDRRVVSDMVAFLDEPRRGEQPFFGFLWLNSVHSYDVLEGATPFKPSLQHINYLALNQDYDPTPYFNRYRNALHFVDGEVGKVLDALERNRLLDDTLVIITSDHGEEFNDTGKNYWGHNGNFSPWQVKVPLLVRWPAWGAGEQGYLTSHYDLAPTLLSGALGCRTAPGAYAIGMPLRETQARRQFLPVFDYNDTGIYEPDRVTLFTNFGGFRVYNHQYDALDHDPRMDVVSAVTNDLLRFTQPPAPRVAGAPLAREVSP